MNFEINLSNQAAFVSMIQKSTKYVQNEKLETFL